jgi:ATP-dependent helicase HrpA
LVVSSQAVRSACWPHDLAARDQQALQEVLIIAAALSVQDPRDRPLEAQAAADQAHKKFADEKSEFISYLKIWKWFEDAIEHKNQPPVAG